MEKLPSLCQKYQGVFDVGASINPEWFARYPELIASQFNSITTECNECALLS